MNLLNHLSRIAACMVMVGLLCPGCAPQGAGAGGGAGSRRLAVSTGNAGTVEVSPDTTAEGVAAAVLPNAPPANARSGRVSVAAANVEFVDAAGKTRGLAQGGGREAQVTIHIAGEDEAEPCSAEFQVLSFTATETDSGILLSNATASLTPSALALVVSGEFVFCIEIVANFSGTVIISDIDFELSETADGGDNENGNADDDSDGDDGDEVDDGENANDNEDDGDTGDDEEDDLDEDDLNDNANDVDDDLHDDHEGNHEEPDDDNVNDNGGDGHDHDHLDDGGGGGIYDQPVNA